MNDTSGDRGTRQKEQIAQIFGLTASDYDQSGVDFFRLFARRLIAHLQPQPGWHVVDVGTGRGAVPLALFDALGTQVSVTAIDLAEPMISALAEDLHHRGIENVCVQVGDAEDLPLPDASADAITASMVLFFLPDLRAALREIHRVLRPGGIAAFTLFGDEDPAWADVYEAFNPFLPRSERLDDSRPRHPQLADTRTIIETLREAGFEQVTCIDEVHPIWFADPAQWHTWSWSVGLRGTWLTIPQDRRDEARSAVLAAVAEQVEPDGTLSERFAIRVVLAQRSPTLSVAATPGSRR